MTDVFEVWWFVRFCLLIDRNERVVFVDGGSESGSDGAKAPNLTLISI
jgi:hypothetical protein